MTYAASSRRQFLKSGGSVLGASWLAINMPLIVSASQKAAENHQVNADFENITSREALEIGAIVDQIIPEDETPAATGVGVVYFIDLAIGGFMATAAPMLKQGLEDVRLKVISAHPHVEHLSELSPDQQREIILLIEDAAFFQTLHFLTMCGMFSLPEYGGNREHAGWELLGFDHRHAWQPPFGHYDEAVHAAPSKMANEDA